MEDLMTSPPRHHENHEGHQGRTKKYQDELFSWRFSAN